jgi:peptide/nickel transport system permease protein
MPLYIAKKLVEGLVLVLIVTLVTSVLLHAEGTEIARRLMGGAATQEAVELRAQQLGLDQPFWTKYGLWLASAFQADFGTSFLNSDSVMSAIGRRLPVTMSIVIISTLFVAILTAILGVLAATKRGWIDRVVQIGNVVVGAIPAFWLALILVVVFAVQLRWFPATGYVPPEVSIGGWLASIALPTTALVISTLGAAFLVRSSILDVLRQDFIRTLRARGMPERTVLFRHALRNAAPPWLTVLSLQFISLIGGAVVIEKVFALPGIGTLLNNAAQSSDIPVVLGVVTVVAILIVIANLVTDIVAGWLNPKVRVS